MVLNKTTYRLISISLLIVVSGFTVHSLSIPPYHQKYMNKRVKRLYRPMKVKVDYKNKRLDSSHKEIAYYVPIKTLKDSTVSYLCYRETSACNFGGCTDTTCKEENQDKFKETIFYYAIIDLQDTVQKLGVLEYESTYGYEIMSGWWLRQFYSKPTGSFKLNDNIDGVSGATVSVKAMIDDINSLQSPDN